MSTASSLSCPPLIRWKLRARPLQRIATTRWGNNDLNTDKGEVGGSSPPRPTIQITSKYAAILTFPLFGDLPQKNRFVNRLSTSRLAGSHCTQGSPRHPRSRMPTLKACASGRRRHVKIVSERSLLIPNNSVWNREFAKPL